MNKKERENLQALEDVCSHAVSYVGFANYDHRERLAQRNVRKAFNDFHDGKKAKWIAEVEEEEA